MAGITDLQEAADRGDLERTTRRAITEQHQQQLAALVDKRWIIIQAVEIAKTNSTITPAEFRELCEFIKEFISSD